MLPDFNLLAELRKFLNKKQIDDLMALVLQSQGNASDYKQALQKLVKDFDWDKYRVQLGKLLAERLPAEQLVPDNYAEWKPVVHEAVTFLGARMSIKRLMPKLLEQVLMDEDTSLEKRMVSFVAQMPSLQKLGQVIARNKNLHPDLRAELMQLENDIHDTTIDDIKSQIEKQLGHKLVVCQVEMEDTIFAEATVCALVRFSWLNLDTNRREPGVFKVIKPHIKNNFGEEMILLKELAAHLDKQDAHVLDEVSLKDTFGEIATLLEQELNTPQEQANLLEAGQRYTDITGLRVPRVIMPLSTDTITAMSYEPGTKVTQAYRRNKKQREQLARQIVEALIAIPLFSADEEVLFHADPHAGNLYVNEKQKQLILFDWALTGRLSNGERRKIILLFLALFLRDEAMLLHTITGLSQNELDNKKTAQIKQAISKFVDKLSLYQLPTMDDLLTLTDDMLLQGVRFSAQMMLFRKVLLTLDGVLHDITDKVAVEKILSDHVLKHCQQEWYGISGARCLQPDFKLPLSGSDTLSLAMSAQWYYYRAGMQMGNQLMRWWQDE